MLHKIQFFDKNYKEVDEWFKRVGFDWMQVIKVSGTFSEPIYFLHDTGTYSSLDDLEKLTNENGKKYIKGLTYLNCGDFIVYDTETKKFTKV